MLHLAITRMARGNSEDAKKENIGEVLTFHFMSERVRKLITNTLLLVQRIFLSAFNQRK